MKALMTPGAIDREGQQTAIVPIIAHIVVVSYYYSVRTQLDAPSGWSFDFTLLAFVSVGCSSLLCTYHRRDGLRWAAYCVGLLAASIASVPFSNSLVPETAFALAYVPGTVRDGSNWIDCMQTGFFCAALFVLSFLSPFRSGMKSIGIFQIGVFWIIISGAAIITVSSKLQLQRIQQLSSQVARLNAGLLRITEKNSGFLAYASDVRRRSTVDERRRITRELHDIVGQTLTNIFAVADAHRKHPPKTVKEQDELFSWISEVARRGLDETRNVLYDLRLLREPEPHGIPLYSELISTFEKASQVSVNVQWASLPWRSNPDVERCVYRVLQESMVNSFRHGKATVIEILFHVENDTIQVVITDNGSGASGDHEGIGKQGMQERVRELGGEISFRNGPNGYKVIARIPV